MAYGETVTRFNVFLRQEHTLMMEVSMKPHVAVKKTFLRSYWRKAMTQITHAISTKEEQH
jgi:hypothetical protein